MEFISLLDVVDSIASEVPIPKGCENGILIGAEVPITPFLDRYGNVHQSKNFHQLKINFLNQLFLSAARQSEAAAALDCYICNANEGALKWFDWSQTGWPKMSATARGDGLQMLAHLAGYFGRLAKAYQSGRFDAWPPSRAIQPYEGQFKSPSDSQRLRKIGFKLTEAVHFLNTHEIPHSLNIASSTNEHGLQDVPSTFSSAPINLPAPYEQYDAVTNVFTLGEKISDPMQGRKVHRIAGRRHVLAQLIEVAQAQVGNSNNESLVFPELVKMAESGMYSIMKGFEPGKGIKYHTDNNYRYFNQSALRKYLRPETRGQKKPKGANK